MQVKVFSADSAEQLEQWVAAWLRQTPDVTITTVTQSSGRGARGEGDGDRIVLTVFYTGGAAAGQGAPGGAEARSPRPLNEERQAG